MKASSAPGIVLPLLLAVIGVSLICWPGSCRSTGREQAFPASRIRARWRWPLPTPGPSGFTPAPTPSGTPIPADWVAVQLEVPSVELNVAVKHGRDGADCSFPPDDAAYILCQSSEPGRGTNSYIVGHALQRLFKRLWNVLLGAEVKVLMSDGAVLRYVVTEIHPNVSCPDERADPMPNPPLALQYAEPGCPGARGRAPTDHERLTLQTSQGFNRNWGELIIVAEAALLAGAAVGPRPAGRGSGSAPPPPGRSGGPGAARWPPPRATRTPAGRPAPGSSADRRP